MAILQPLNLGGSLVYVLCQKMLFNRFHPINISTPLVTPFLSISSIGSQTRFSGINYVLPSEMPMTTEYFGASKKTAGWVIDSTFAVTQQRLEP
jgi:hypothetical protein